MTKVWVKGYVVGYDEAQGELLWKVKVKDPASVHDGQKFVVHSTMGPTLTRPSADVSFRIEPIQVGTEQVLKAVDVRLSTTAQAEPTVESKPAKSEESETYDLYVIEDSGGNRTVICTGFANRQEAEDWYEQETGGDERVVDVLNFSIHEVQTLNDSAEIPGAFAVIEALSSVDNTREALEKLFTAIYRLGRRSV